MSDSATVGEIIASFTVAVVLQNNVACLLADIAILFNHGIGLASREPLVEGG